MTIYVLTQSSADDTSLFKVVYDEQVSSSVLNNDLKTIKSWAFQWKMQFNPDPKKQAVQIIFSRKRTKPDHPQIFFNDTAVSQLPKHTHLGLTLDSELTFTFHIQKAITKAGKGIGVFRFKSKYLHRDVLDQLYKLYVRPHLDYYDIIYHKHYPDLKLDFTKKLESVQYSATLAVSGAWKGTNTDRIYEELWEPLYYRKWQRRLTHFYKLITTRSLSYLYEYVPQCREVSYNLRRNSNYENYAIRTESFSHSYFPYCVREWNQLDPQIEAQPSVSLFKKKLIELIRPNKHSIYKVVDLKGVQLLTRLRVKFSDLHEHRFRHNFFVTPVCMCNKDDETTEHYLLRCCLHRLHHVALLENVSIILKFDVSTPSERDLCLLLLYGDDNINEYSNRSLLEWTIKFIHDSGRF